MDSVPVTASTRQGAAAALTDYLPLPQPHVDVTLDVTRYVRHSMEGDTGPAPESLIEVLACQRECFLTVHRHGGGQGAGHTQMFVLRAAMCLSGPTRRLSCFR